jgi:glyoxylase-like metal-dependent hydrolase (beta-lactamase superfamily II)
VTAPKAAAGTGEHDRPVPGAVQREAWAAGLLPPVEQVRPDLWSIPVPLPNNPLRYVLVYALAHDDGLALIDAGWDTNTAWQTLIDGVRTTGHEIRDVTAVIATHVHPDHYGLAHRIRQASGAWVALHPADARLLEPDAAADLPPLVAAARELFASSGAPEVDVSPALIADAAHYLTPTEPPDRPLTDGQQLRFGRRTLTVVHTPGHTPGHVCLHDRDDQVLFTGDHVLPRITSTVGLHSRPDHDALGQFLSSLARIAELADNVGEVLPAHEYRFTGLLRRVDDLLAHHEERLTATRRAVASHTGRTAWQVAQHLDWARPWDDIDPIMQRLAAAETLAHLVLLRHRGHVQGTAEWPRTWSVRP